MSTELVMTKQSPAAAPTPARARVPALVKSLLKGLLFGSTSIGLVAGVWYLINALFENALPDPLSALGTLWTLLADPFYDNGPNDQGIGHKITASLGNVMQGFLMGSLLSIPIGIFMGMNQTFQRIMNPIAQVLRPVSPLAWFPIGLAAMKSAGAATVFVIFITSLWPTLINTAFGVSSLPADYKTLAKVYRFSPKRYLMKIILPYSLPFILTGLRLSLGIAWMVIVAAEMLSGGQGIGFFVWDSWNSLSLEKVISAIIIIGVIGLLMDRVMEYFVKKASHRT